MARIGILALQGAFIEHERMLREMGAECIEIRNKKQLAEPISGLVLPGGESTVQRKLLIEEGLLQPLKEKIQRGMPVLATCAGLILLAKEIEGGDPVCFGTLPVTVRKNAYGRQLGSFITEEEFKGLGKIKMNFIRAPYVVSASPETEILARADGNIVAVRYKHQTALAFHPEVGTDERIHEMFYEEVLEGGEW